MTQGRPTRADIYRTLNAQVADLWSRLGGLPSPLEAQDIWNDIWIAEAHHSTAVEGNTLALIEVQRLLNDGIAAGAKPLREYNEVKGYADAAIWVYRHGLEPDGESGSPITLHDVRSIHAMVLTPVWDISPHRTVSPDEAPGSFRRHEIAEFSGGMKPPTWPLVEARMGDWVGSAASLTPQTLEFPEQLARLHHEFEVIHPFLDGNGRTGRLLLNLALIKSGYPPAIVYKKDRAAYLRSLRQADRGDYGALGELIARSILDNLYRFILPNVAGPARLVPLAALADDKLSANALRTAANRGTLQATRCDGNAWQSSRRWVDEYKAQRGRRA